MDPLTTQILPRIVTPVYRAIDGAIDHEGSGVLVQSQRNGKLRFWLFTADHVLDHHPFLVLLGSSNVILYADRFVRFPDPLDVAIAEIAPPDASILRSRGLSFLSDFNIGDSNAPVHDSECVLLGYPDASVEIDGDARRTFAKSTILYSRFKRDGNWDKRFYDPKNQFYAPFDGFWTVDRMRISEFDPHGLSGGAIMQVTDHGLILVGIVTQWDQCNRLLIGTQLNRVLDEMYQRAGSPF